MKVVILAGGYGTRISEESSVRPKPMVEIGNRPILWHIMKIYASFGLNDFVICCGYKGHVIKEWFASYALHHSDVTFDFRAQTTEFHRNDVDPWRVTLVDTGESTMTGGRLRRVRDYVGEGTFCLTYGDGVSDIDVGALLAAHRAHGTIATLTAVQPEGRFGAFQLREGQTRIDAFREKPRGDGAWINGGFFVLESTVFDYIRGDDTVFEQEPLRDLAGAGQLSAFRHPGFWMAMDTLRDRNVLEQIWARGDAPWKRW